MHIQKIRETKISDNFVGLVEIQEKNWQFMIENFVGRTETFYLKEKIILKELKRNYLEKKLKKNTRFTGACTTLSIKQFLKIFVNIFGN